MFYFRSRHGLACRWPPPQACRGWRFWVLSVANRRPGPVIGAEADDGLVAPPALTVCVSVWSMRPPIRRAVQRSPHELAEPKSMEAQTHKSRQPARHGATQTEPTAAPAQRRREEWRLEQMGNAGNNLRIATRRRMTDCTRRLHTPPNIAAAIDQRETLG